MAILTEKKEAKKIFLDFQSHLHSVEDDSINKICGRTESAFMSNAFFSGQFYIK